MPQSAWVGFERALSESGNFYWRVSMPQSAWVGFEPCIVALRTCARSVFQCLNRRGLDLNRQPLEHGEVIE
jgi:hypothetical protein